MLGLMQNSTLTIDKVLRRGEALFGDQTVVSNTGSGIQRAAFRAVAARARRLGGALESLGLSRDARVGTFAWNTVDHLALYFAVPCTGRVLHTINIRYFPEQVRYTIGHAEDEAVFVDRSLFTQFARYLPDIPTVKHIVVMEDGTDGSLPDDPRIVGWDELMSRADEIDLNGRVSEERTAAALCYTTGTTGNPKGVLYEHRSVWLHANAGAAAAGAAITDRDTVLPVVPMFHAMAWGLPYTAYQAGAKLVLPGSDLSPETLLDLMESERVSYASGVPTIWMGMLPLLPGRDLSALDRIIAGGSAIPQSLSEAWRDAVGVPITQGWGMTEVSPVGALGILRAEHLQMSEAEQSLVRARAGMPIYGVEIRIVDPDTREVLPWDDAAVGDLEVSGPWVVREYYKAEGPGEDFSSDGWLRTGDVAAVAPDGFLRLVDRSKDLIKSGGEWISSVDLENTIMAHPAVAEAAVIAVPHPKWMERPMACVVLREGEAMTADELLEFLRARLERWQVPDEVVFISELPKTSVGKFSKKTLRDLYAGSFVGSV